MPTREGKRNRSHSEERNDEESLLWFDNPQERFLTSFGMTLKAAFFVPFIFRV
jgi:hypothetical protein